MSLSLVVIFKNEAAYIENCIRSVLPIVDEVIAVDAESTDGSDTLVQAFQMRDSKIKYLRRTWPHDFSDQKNYAIAQATKDWILFLDADERISLPDHKKIREAIENQNVDAYELPIFNYTLDYTEVGYVPNSEAPYPFGYVVTNLHRLFRRDSRFRYEGIIHEKIEPSLVNAGARLQKLDAPIRHLGRIKEAEHGLRQQRYEFYLALAQKKVDENPKDAQSHWELGVVYQKLLRLKEAQSEFERALELSPSTEEFEIYLGLVLFQQSAWNDLLRIAFKNTKALFFQTVARAQTNSAAIEELDQYRETFSQSALIILELSLRHHREDRLAADRQAAITHFEKSGLVEYLEGAQKRREGDFANARAFLEIATHKGCQAAVLELLLSMTQAKDFDSAIQYYHRLSDSERGNLSSDSRKVVAFAAQQMGKEVETYLRA